MYNPTFIKKEGMQYGNKYASFKVLILDEWLIQDLSKDDIEFIFELSERHFDSASTVFCTLYRQEDWVTWLNMMLF